MVDPAEEKSQGIACDYAEALNRSVNCLCRYRFTAQEYQILLALVSHGCILGYEEMWVNSVGDIAPSTGLSTVEVSRALSRLRTRRVISSRYDRPLHKLFVRMNSRSEWLLEAPTASNKKYRMPPPESEMEEMLCLNLTLSKARLVVIAISKYFDAGTEAEQNEILKYIRDKMGKNQDEADDTLTEFPHGCK
jgi:hypothetical protein